MWLIKEKLSIIYFWIIIFFCIALPSIFLFAIGANLVDIYQTNKLYKSLKENWILIEGSVVNIDNEGYNALSGPSTNRGFAYEKNATMYKFTDSNNRTIYNNIDTEGLKIWNNLMVLYDPNDSSRNIIDNKDAISFSWNIGLILNQFLLFFIFFWISGPQIPKFYKKIKYNLRLIKKSSK